MPATDSTVEGSAMGSGGSSGSGDKTVDRKTGLTVIGLLAFGLTSILFGLSQLPGPYGNGFVTKTPYVNALVALPGGTVVTTMGVLGGLILLIVGIICLWNGVAPYWGAVFLGFGAFWTTFATVVSVLNNHVLYGYGTAGFMLIWVLFTLTFLISSFKHGWVTFIFFLVLFVANILLLVEFWQWGSGSHPTNVNPGISGPELGVIGGIWILAGIIAWYAGTARLAEHTYGRKLLPG